VLCISLFAICNVLVYDYLNVLGKDTHCMMSLLQVSLCHVYRSLFTIYR